ncbi:uncharacterized protein LOC125532089 isoform X5 [Triticum urartu]|uniref:uncharacterized protein LOC125532089 isoform X5 n=1 Tax=Triticum urartu TaxID=4572 RepID=UPI00204362DD|nr:uncharacterized protein LOC125532089 isoform X5 [Triticum urartu]
MWAGSEVGEDSSAGRQQASVLRSVSSLFFSLRRGEAANDREKEQAVDECKQKGRATASTSDGNTPRFLWSCHTPITVEMGNGMGMGLQGCENGLEDRVSSDMCPQVISCQR